MKLKELITAVSVETSIPAGDVRKVTLSILRKFAQLIRESDQFNSSIISVKGVKAPAKPASDGRPDRPVRMFARMKIAKKKPQSPEQLVELDS
jgi:hypothetical protein